MMPSIFGTKKVDRSPVFTEDDIRTLIISFPPPEPRPGKESLVCSLSGRSLVRSDAVIKRFHSLLKNASGPIFLNSLHNELGVQDVQWLLNQEDERICYSRDRRRLLPESTQKAIYHGIQRELSNGGADLNSIATDKDVTPTTLRRMLTAQDAALSLKDLEDGKAYDSSFLEKLKNELSKTIEGAQNAVVLSDTFPQVPASWLESTAESLVSTNGDDGQGVVEMTSGGLRYTPQSLLVQHESELKQTQDVYIRKAVEELATNGYCEVTGSSRPQILQTAGDSDLTQAILEADARKSSSSDIVQLSTRESSFLITQEALSIRTSAIATKAEGLATEQWPTRRAGEDVVFDSKKLLASSEVSSLDLAILESSDPENRIKSAFEAQILKLQQETADKFATTIQTDLLTPLKLYTQAADTITDTTLQPRVQEFIYDWSRKELIQETLRTIKDSNLISSKSTSRDVDKFSDAVQAAKTLEDILTATAKLARKQKIDQPSASLLFSTKQEILGQKVAGMRKLKRASDLLQNVIWILLAGKREGLYMSSGKDTSRMIKMVKEGDAEAGVKLEEWRNLIKQGGDTEDTRREMRDAAAEAIDEFKNIPKATSDEKDKSTEEP
ncbi:hypothetical protein E4T42_00134 [Aureobasidium subglaciale]|nr:hypothetical protein E4T42_00134 [Aureobasidium subglaciale]